MWILNISTLILKFQQMKLITLFIKLEHSPEYNCYKGYKAKYALKNYFITVSLV